MSNMYSIDVVVDVPLTQNNIRMILQRAIDAGCIFYEKFMTTDQSALGIDAAVSKIFNDLACSVPCWDVEHEKGLFVSFEGSQSTLFVFRENDHFSISYLIQGYPKYVNFESQEYVDFAYYLSFLLVLCKHFPILKIETHIDY